MTFEPTPTMIEALWNELPNDAHVFHSDVEDGLKALFTHLQNNPDDARVFVEGFMTPTLAEYQCMDEKPFLYRLPEV